MADTAQVANSSNIENKTPSRTALDTATDTSSAAKPAFGTIVRTNKKNPLNAYRSYNYKFTLASLKKEALVNSEDFRVNQNYFIILKSGGKGSAGIQPPLGLSQNAENLKQAMQSSQEAKSASNVSNTISTDYTIGLLNQFNSESAGRFDFYIDNVEIESIIGGGEVTSMSIATKIEFEVIETYSMTGFIEALQVSAVAAGHDSYVNCPYLLKMEFIGYRDSDELLDSEIVPYSTRYFVMGFTGLDINVTEAGARYRCKCVPFNEKGFGAASILAQDIQASGTTVETILKSFIDGVNKSIKADINAEGTSEDRDMYDEYEIVFPLMKENGLDTSFLTDSSNYTKNKIASSTVVELLKSNAVYQFAHPGDEENIRLDPNNPAIHFAKGVDIYDCIISIVRDSSYTRNILTNFKVDDRGMVKYFMIHMEVIKKGLFDKKRNKDCYKYRYVVIEYDLHYTRIQPRPADVVDTSKLKQAILREYNYFYTGSNVDIKKLDLKFNTLFFQAIPRTMGNKPSTPAAAGSVQSTDPSKATNVESKPNNSAIGNAAVRDSVLRGEPVQNGNLNTSLPQPGPFEDLAKGMHQAILENVDQCQAEIEIFGDPFYLVTNGSGNQRLTLNADGSCGDGEAAAYMGDVHILITFRNPIDIDTDSGFAFFDNRSALYSGVFRVLTVKSSFRAGEFSQKLELIRMPYQLEDTNQQPTKTTTALVQSIPDPSKASTEVPPVPISSVRATTDDLLSEIANSVPLTGLPSDLSNLIPGNLGGLAGTSLDNNAIGSLVNSVSSLASGAISAVGSLINQNSGPITEGLSNISSALRLADSGLSALSATVNSDGGAVNQISNLANSVGLTNITPTKLGSALLETGNSTVDSIGESAISKVNSLGETASGLSSRAASKISGLNGRSSALAAQLGITPNSLSGLSPNLQASIVEKITKAVETIPKDVDVTSAIRKGLLFNNIPVSKLKNIPASQPDAAAPTPALNLSDIKFILDRGGSLENLPGALSVPGVSNLLKSTSLPTISQNNTFNKAVIADKLSSIQAGLETITGNSSSLEASLNNISAVVPTGVPNVSSVDSSVVSKFGSVSNSLSSPLKTLIKNNSLG